MPTLEWIGKSKVINHHQEVPFRVLERKYSFDESGQHNEDNGSENMIIRGDNLEALKALLPRYEGRIKCIYIDPPYNTGNEGWVYNDNVNDPKIKKWLGEVVGKEGEDLTRHDKWLCMMYPRLKLLQMSSKSNTWMSCHRLNGGGYQAGCLSYMNDSVSMVFYAVDADVHGEYRKAIRRYRQMFFYKDGTLYQSRLYPADTGNALEVSKLFRHLVQKAISRCLTEPNLWYLKTKRSDLDAHYSTRRGSLHYPDYDFHGNLSILQGHKKDTVLPIGAVALCVCCGNELWSNGDIKCSCKEVVVCRKCGQTVARDQGIYLEDGFYCKTCLHICEACGRPTLGTMYPAYDRRGSLLQICHDCYQQLTASCSSCSMAAACRTMGFTICKKATIPVAA
mgnify:CR=1 FL=1